jgi:microcystin-dependent protein
MAFTNFTNYQRNPFTKVFTDYQRIEVRTIPATPPYIIQLRDLPILKTPNVTTIAGMTEVFGTSTPSADTFVIDYMTTNTLANPNLDTYESTGMVLFHSSDAGETVTITYNAVGSINNMNNACQVSDIKMMGTTTATPGWLLCNGAAISRTIIYNDLFDVIGTTFGVGDNSTTYNIPDFRGIFPKGAGTTARAAGKDASGAYYTGTLGAYQTDLTYNHTHPITDPGHGHRIYESGAYAYDLPLVTTGHWSNDTTISVDSAITGITVNNSSSARMGNLTYPANLSVGFFIKY